MYVCLTHVRPWAVPFQHALFVSAPLVILLLVWYSPLGLCLGSWKVPFVGVCTSQHFEAHRQCLLSPQFVWSSVLSPRPSTLICLKGTGTREESFCKTCFQLAMGAKNSTQTRQRWKNARSLPYICCVVLQVSDSLLTFTFFHLCVASVLFSPIPS